MEWRVPKGGFSFAAPTTLTRSILHFPDLVSSCVFEYHSTSLSLIFLGRCDVWVEFTFATQEQARRLFLHFYQTPSKNTSLNNIKSETLEHQSIQVDKEKFGVLSPPPSPDRSPSDAVKKNIEVLADRFADAIPAGKINVSALQAFMMRYKRQPGEAVEAVEKWVDEGFPQRPTATLAAA